MKKNIKNGHSKSCGRLEWVNNITLIKEAKKLECLSRSLFLGYNKFNSFY